MVNLKKNLGQIDTPVEIARTLIKHIDNDFGSFIDIGVGLGNLSAPILNMSGVGIEIDTERVQYLKKLNRNNVKIVEADFLQENFDLSRFLKPNKTLFLSNPPFNRGKSGHIFKKFINTGQYHQLDIAFLDKTLSYLKDSSTLLFIMSSPFIEFQSHRKLREIFIKEFAHIEVISLNDNIYKNTEVESYAIIGYKVKKPFKATYTLSKMNEKGYIVEEIEINQKHAIESLSFNFHKEKFQILNKIGKSDRLIGDLISDIRRGSRTRKQFDQIGLSAIHTSDLTNNGLSFKNNIIYPDSSFNLACENDILISRVGKRSIAREAIIRDGNNYFTDSVLKLTATNAENSNILWNNVSSDIGKMWRKVHSQGKCAKYLTSESITCMPIHC